MNDTTRICAKCGADKPLTLEFFYKKLDGFQYRCKTCVQAMRRSPAIKDQENESRRKRRQADLGKAHAEDRRRYLRRREKQIARQRRQRDADPEKYAARDRLQYLKNRERRIQQANKWAMSNPERKREIAKGVNKRQRLNPTFRLRCAMSAYINWCLHRKKNGMSWEGLVGYSLNDLVAHLERQFQRGMSWKNYGQKGWHIDHIIPASSFTYDDPKDEQFKACWALTNLRPMWAGENISKGHRRIHLI